MDFYDTASTAVGQLIQVAIFIKGLITDIKVYTMSNSKLISSLRR